MPVPEWTAAEIAAYSRELDAPKIYWRANGMFAGAYKPQLKEAYERLVADRKAAAAAA